MLQKIGIKKCNSTDLKYFKSSYTNEKLSLKKDMPDIDHIVSFMVEPTVNNIRILNTIDRKSAEGNKAFGKYVQLDILFKEKILYVPRENDNDLQYIERTYYESCSVAISEKIEGTNIEYLLNINRLPCHVSIEDVSIQLFNERTLLINVYYIAELKYVQTYELAYISKETNNKTSLYLNYCDGTKPIEKFQVRKHKCISPKWSENGVDIGFLSNEHGNFLLYVINSKTRNIKCITEYYEFNRVIDYTWKDKNTVIFSGILEESIDLFSINIITKELKQLTISPDFVNNYKPRYSRERNSIAFLRDVKTCKNLWEVNCNGEEQRKLTDVENIKEFCWTYKSRYIAAACKGDKNTENIVIIDMEFDDQYDVNIPVKYSKIGKICASPIDDIISFVGINEENHIEDIFIYIIKKRKLIQLTHYNESVNISSMVWKIDGEIIYFSTNELGYYNIFSMEIKRNTKRHICATNSSYIELDYRPSNC